MKPSDLISPPWKEWEEMSLSKHVNLIKEYPGLWLEVLEYEYNGSVYGGFMENRSVFFDERHDPDCVIHVGYDLWAAEYTPITFPFKSTVIYSRPENKHCRGGWGGRLDLLVDDRVYILGHLLNPFQKMGDLTIPGEIIGSLANRKENGGWKPHLHIQCMPFEYYSIFGPDKIDAYSEPLANLDKMYLNVFE